MKLSEYDTYSIRMKDALQALHSSERPANILAGGIDSPLDIQQGYYSPVARLVDKTDIPEINLLEHRAEEIFIEAAVPHQVMTTSSPYLHYAQAFAQGSESSCKPDVKTMAALEGDLAHTLPAPDGTIALNALNARVETSTIERRRSVPLANLFKYLRKLTIEPEEQPIQNSARIAHAVYERHLERAH